MESFDTPVVLLLFRRVEGPLRIVDRLRSIRASKIYLLSDGWRHESERALVEEVRVAVRAAIDWPCTIVERFADQNIGVHANIGLGALWVFQREQRAIFLEDDNVPEVTFFTYCQELLDRYERDLRVLWVCGTNYLTEFVPDDGSSYMFTRHLLPCGWASWSNKFTEYYDADLQLFSNPALLTRVRASYADAALGRQQLRSVEREFWRRSQGKRYGSWDYHMIWSVRAHGMLGIAPVMNQIQNIGADAFATHSGKSLSDEMTRRFTGMQSRPLELPLRHPPTVIVDPRFEKLIDDISKWPLILRVRSQARYAIGNAFRLDPSTSITGNIKRFFRGKAS